MNNNPGCHNCGGRSTTVGILPILLWDVRRPERKRSQPVRNGSSVPGSRGGGSAITHSTCTGGVSARRRSLLRRPPRVASILGRPRSGVRSSNSVCSLLPPPRGSSTAHCEAIAPHAKNAFEMFPPHSQITQATYRMLTRHSYLLQLEIIGHMCIGAVERWLGSLPGP